MPSAMYGEKRNQNGHGRPDDLIKGGGELADRKPGGRVEHVDERPIQFTHEELIGGQVGDDRRFSSPRSALMCG